MIIKNDKSVKIELDSRKRKKKTIEIKTQMPNMEECISRIQRKIANGQGDNFGSQTSTYTTRMVNYSFQEEQSSNAFLQ